MDTDDARRRLSMARVGRLATADARGVPHVVPCVFVLDGDSIYWAVDRKPKRSARLRRLHNIRANPNVEVVVDHFDEDWSRLWWVRASGRGRIVSDEAERDRALAMLAEKYEQYRTEPPEGPVVAIDVARWSAWEGSEGR
jgi:PPOX class probable F420-dependent enzyme